MTAPDQSDDELVLERTSLDTDASRAVGADPVHEALAAIHRCDWQRLKPLLHPYLRWTTEEGRTLRGRAKVMGRMVDAPPADKMRRRAGRGLCPVHGRHPAAIQP